MASNLNAVGVGQLFQLLRDGVPRTRSELASALGLARSTVAVRVEQLLEMELITPVATAGSTGGRPPSRFALNPAAKVVVAVDIGASHTTAAIADLSGDLLLERHREIAVSLGPEVVLGWLADVVTEMMAEAGLRRDRIAAVGIGVPGPVEHSTGRPARPPIMPGWDGFDVPGWVQQHLDVPVLVDNDVNISAIGERAMAWPSTDHLVFVKVATGIGAGIISDGRLLRGAEGIAGDLGHVRVARGGDALCHCGNTGCLEALASGPAIARTLSAQGIEASTGKDVVELVKAGNLDAIQAVRQAGRDLGEVLTASVSLLNPSVIVIGGAMARVGEHLIAGVREVIYSRSMPLATEHLAIVQSAVASEAAVRGAAMLAVEYALSPEILPRSFGLAD